jgi:hypothetical protein
MGGEKKMLRPQRRDRQTAEKKSVETTTKIEPLKGGLEQRYVRCGRSNCKCSKGELHGPYYIRRWQRHGQRRSKYVKKSDVSATFQACLEYKRDRQETRELIREINETGSAMLRALGEVIRRWQP